MGLLDAMCCYRSGQVVGREGVRKIGGMVNPLVWAI